MQSLDFMIALCGILIFTAAIIPILYDFKLNLEQIEIQDQEFSDYCNIVYITSNQIEVKPVMYNKSWCLGKVDVSDYIFIEL